MISFSRMYRERSHFVCACSCGAIVEVQAKRLISGHTKSCGCLKREVLHRSRTTHGMSHGRLYYAWQHMKERCYRRDRQQWKDYGGRGIRVCDEWMEGFEAFCKWALRNGYQSHLFLDRRDNDGNYSPENCRWVTRTVQNRNTRANHFIEYLGKRQTVAEWAEQLGINRWNIHNRIKYGCDPVSALMYGKKMPSGAPRRHPGLDNATSLDPNRVPSKLVG